MNTGPLVTAERIGLVGDIHGDVARLVTVLQFLADAGVRAVVGLGDVGLGWPGSDVEAELAWLDAVLEQHGQVFYWVDGNHENFPWLHSHPLAENGTRPVTSRIVHLPRGWRVGLDSGRSLAVLGGANSIDKAHRGPDSWWPEESITSGDLAALSGRKASILLGHDAPMRFPRLDRQLAASAAGWSGRALAYARQGRRRFHRGLLAVRPDLYVGGHYHFFADQWLGFLHKGRGFASRAVTLDILQHDGASVAVLDPVGLDLEFFTREGRRAETIPPVRELTAASTGRWMVHSQGSSHLLDLDAGYTIRYPGPTRPDFFRPGRKRLRTLERCRVGAPGYWTMAADHYLDDYLWLRCSVIHTIEPAPPVDPDPEYPTSDAGGEGADV